MCSFFYIFFVTSQISPNAGLNSILSDQEKFRQLMGMAGLMGGASGKEVITRMGEEEEGADMEEDLDVEDVKEEGECETRADSDSKVQETACGAVSPASKTKSV